MNSFVRSIDRSIACLLVQVDPDATFPPTVIDAAPGAVVVDGMGGFAPAAFLAGLPLFAEKAKSQGIATMAVRNARHFAALWFECELLAERYDLASLAMVNSKSFVAQPGGTGERLWGTNPMAFCWPRGGGLPPIVFDQAAASMARGEIQLLANESNNAAANEDDDGGGKILPEGVAVDSQGLPTRNPTEALLGAQLPFGGHKGANIALMVEVLAAGLTGGNFGFESHDEDEYWGGPTSNGELIIAINPETFASTMPGSGFSALETGRKHMNARVEMLLKRLEAAGGRLPGNRRHTTRKNETEAAEESGSGHPIKEDSLYVDIPDALHGEILDIVAGEMNRTQGYAFPEGYEKEEAKRDIDTQEGGEKRQTLPPKKTEKKKESRTNLLSRIGAAAQLPESDLEESFVKGSGRGGQKINKTRNCVVLKHIPTGLSVRCQKTRKLADNRRIARSQLALKVDEMLQGERSVRSQRESIFRDKKKRKKARARRRQRAREKERE